MVDFIFAAQKQTYLKIAKSSKLFPVNRVYAIGQNYAEHTIEMGNDPKRSEPFFFQKNPDNLNDSGCFILPQDNSEIHYEVELFIALQQGGENISNKQANDCIFGYGIAIDLTKRSLQKQLKEKGKPWAVAKAFENSAPCSLITPKDVCGLLENGPISLAINETIKQQGNINQMIWKIPEIINKLSQFFTLKAGDIILTGTPSGVGPIRKNDKLIANIANLPTLEIKIN